MVVPSGAPPSPRAGEALEKYGASESDSFLMDRNLNDTPHRIIRSKGSILLLDNGQEIFDGSCGAAVSCIGHGDEDVIEAIVAQHRQLSYCHSMWFGTTSASKLGEELIRGTDNKMSRAFIVCSGSEAIEAAMKLACQYFEELGQPQRVNFIAREHSYHGTTLGALSMSGHVIRRAPFLKLLSPYVHRVSACNAYRQRCEPETDAEFVARKSTELENKFRELGPRTVIGFVCETISGAALGCVPYVPGYLAAMKAVCSKYGALFILDEIMCGMGRSGTLHAWQAEDSEGHDCVPDIQAIGKGLGGGYGPVAGILVGHNVVKALKDGSGAFAHGQTYQAHPASCAAALAVQQIIVRDDLLENVRVQGTYLSSLLHQKLDSHPNVGDIRGMGLFRGIEFVQDKRSKEPFDPGLSVAQRIKNTAFSRKWSMCLYPATGCVDGIRGDHVIISPAYNITRKDVEFIATTVDGIIREVFDTLEKELQNV